jgi:acyl carrier protein
MTDYEKYHEAFVSTFELDNSVEVDAAKLTFQSIESWDSIGHMSLIAAIEAAFNVRFSTDDIIALSSFEKGIEILRNMGVEI